MLDLCGKGELLLSCGGMVVEEREGGEGEREKPREDEKRERTAAVGALL